jgi:hypothetical protein
MRLRDDERVFIMVRFHLVRLVPIVVPLLGAMVLPHVIMPSLRDTELGRILSSRVTLGVEIAAAVWVVARWLRGRLIVSDGRFAIVSGVVVATTRSWPLRLGAERLRYVRSPFGLALGYGTLVLKPPDDGRPQLSLWPVPAPEKIYIQLSEVLYGITFFQADPAGEADDGERL